MCKDASVWMAHGIMEWGVDLQLQDAGATRVANQVLDGSIIFKIIEKIWRGEHSMEDALKEAGLSKSSAMQVYKARKHTAYLDSTHLNRIDVYLHALGIYNDLH